MFFCLGCGLLRMHSVAYGACSHTDGERYIHISQEKDLQGPIYREGGFLRLLAHVHTPQRTVTLSPEAGEICQLKALRAVCHGGLGHMYGC